METESFSPKHSAVLSTPRFPSLPRHVRQFNTYCFSAFQHRGDNLALHETFIERFLTAARYVTSNM